MVETGIGCGKLDDNWGGVRSVAMVIVGTGTACGTLDGDRSVDSRRLVLV